jgi:uncharacterized protein (TIGR00730 family)
MEDKPTMNSILSKRPLKRICVFCGSSIGARAAYREAAEALGDTLARQGIGLVYGGASVGLMGAVADAALAAGGEVIGVIPKALMERELAHRGLSECHVVPSMHARKAMMAELSDGFIALPGGIGTLEELFEVWTWAQIGYHDKPIGLLDVADYYAPLRAFVENIVSEGFLRPAYRDMIRVDSEPARLIQALCAYQPPAIKWQSPPEPLRTEEL